MEEVIQREKDLVYRLAFSQCHQKDQADDIFQNVMYRYLKRKPSFKSLEHEKAWFIRITINLSKNKVHSFWHRNITLSEEGIFPCHITQQEGELMEIIMGLPKKYRVVIYLHYYEGYTLTEIAGLLNRSPNTIQTWHKQAKAILRKKIGVDYDERPSGSNEFVSKDT